MENWQAKYEHLKGKVKNMLDAQQAYFKSGKTAIERDKELLKTSKEKEKELRDLVDPPLVRQKTFFDEGR